MWSSCFPPRDTPIMFWLQIVIGSQSFCENVIQLGSNSYNGSPYLSVKELKFLTMIHKICTGSPMPAFPPLPTLFQISWPRCYSWNIPECSLYRLFTLAVCSEQNTFLLDVCIVNSPNSSKSLLIHPLVNEATLFKMSTHPNSYL